jgi:regulator of sigma E protease
MNYLIGLLVLLGVLIFVHEAGHFLAAKWAGIWVHRFALGLGAPIKALSFTRNGTEYSICWLPLGGYVKMASREEEATTSALEGGTPAGPAVPEGMYYEDQPVWKRMVVTLAGVTMNLALALFIFFGLALVQGRTIITELRVGGVDIAALPPGAEVLRQLRVGDKITRVAGEPVRHWDEVYRKFLTAGGDDVSLTVNDSVTYLVRIHADQIERRALAFGAISIYLPPVLGRVAAGTPAERAGLQVGDTVRAVDGKAVLQWEQLVRTLRSSPGRAVTLEVVGAAGTRTVVVTPDSVKDEEGKVIGQIGVAMGQPPIAHETLGIGGAAGDAWTKVEASSGLIFKTLRGMLVGRVSGRNLGGPIAIGQQAGESLSAGFDSFLVFMATISVNLAVINLFPIPILDGGQMIFLLAEGVMRRPLSIRIREHLMFAGFILIVALMIFVFWNDLSRLWPAIVAGWHRIVG